MNEVERARILGELGKRTGQVESWRFFKHTSDYLPGIERFHNLVTGIFKPQDSDYALTIRVTLGSPYERRDKVQYGVDGLWKLEYAPRAGEMAHADNRSLLKCMADGVPFGVLLQESDKSYPQGSTYRILGLGMATGYDSERQVFLIESAGPAGWARLPAAWASEEEQAETWVCAHLANEFSPFERSATLKETSVAKQQRTEAFRRIVAREYGYGCAVCGRKVKLGDLAEAEAAHIVPKAENGSDDLRNGLALCRSDHWLFDNGLIGLEDDLRLLHSPSLRRAETDRLTLPRAGSALTRRPEHEAATPHVLAVRWHREHVYRR